MTPWRKWVLMAGVSLLAAGCQTTGNKEAYEAALKKAAQPKAAPETQAEPEAAVEPETEVPTAAEIADGRQYTSDQQRFKSYEYDDLDPGERPAKDTDEAGLWMAMDRAERKLSTGGAIITDPALNAYVRDITCDLAGDYCADIRVYIVRVPTFNASMAPNGMMNVYSGLLLRAQNEAQLATVIGHEIGHYLRRHSAQRIENIVNATGGLAAFQLLTAALGVPIVGSVATIAASGSLAAFSRDNEREADGYGLLLMGRAGYEPREAAKIWENLKREYANKDKKRSIFYASHPPQEERASILAELAEVVPVEGEPKLNTERYRAAIAPYRFSFLQDELGKRDPDTFEPLLDMLIEDGFQLGMLHYFKGEMFRVRGDKGDPQKALEAYALAEAGDDPPPELFRSKGLVLNRIGEKEQAQAAFKDYIRLAPDAKDRQMIEFLITGVGS